MQQINRKILRYEHIYLRDVVTLHGDEARDEVASHAAALSGLTQRVAHRLDTLLLRLSPLPALLLLRDSNETEIK